jgi:cytochrome c-type biogenesis protein CcmH/NrfG
MSNLWIAIAVSLLAAIVYVLVSVRSQLAIEQETLHSSSSPLIIIVLLLLSSPIAYYGLGNHEKQSNWIEANQSFQQLVDAAPNASGMSIQSMVLSLRTAVDKDRKNGQLWFMLAESYFQLGMVDLADAAITKAIEIEPRANWFVANAQILSIRSNESDISRSVYLLRNALMVSPNHQSALLTLGFIYRRQHNYSAAISTWDRLVTLLDKSGNDSRAVKRQIELARKKQDKNEK